MDKEKNIIPVTAFYDAIADDYDSRMSDGDAKVRREVGKIFRQHIGGGNVLDFGGGTGLDLSWLLPHGYRVFFLEPSVNMRAVAKRTAATAGISHPVFIEENTDISDWTSGHLPFDEKVNGVLANFAVLNCVEDIETFFEKIRLICAKHCYLIATVLHSHPYAILRKYALKDAFNLFFEKSLMISNNSSGTGHATYIHSLRRFRSAAGKYFNYISCISLDPSDFDLLIFSAK